MIYLLTRVILRSRLFMDHISSKVETPSTHRWFPIVKRDKPKNKYRNTHERLHRLPTSIGLHSLHPYIIYYILYIIYYISYIIYHISYIIYYILYIIYIYYIYMVLVLCSVLLLLLL